MDYERGQAQAGPLIFLTIDNKGEASLQVLVRDNNVEQATAGTEKEDAAGRRFSRDEAPQSL